MTGRLAATGAALAALMACTSASALDIHQLWDNRCHECHGHAGPFARRHLTLKDGALVGRHQQDLRRFLAQHEGGAAAADAIYGMLLAQAGTKPVYQQKCAGCHETAAQLARGSLVFRDGTVVGRSNGQPIAEFLKRHGKLDPDEVPVVVESLTRVMREIGAMPAAR